MGRRYITTETRSQVIGLLDQGAGPGNVKKLTGLNTQTVYRWSKEQDRPKTEMSGIYPRISKFSEARLTEAAQQGMGIEQAASYAGVSDSSVRGFWRRIKHDYITPEQEKRIHFGIDVCSRKNEIARYAGIRNSDLDYFMSLRGITLLPPYNPSNPLANFRPPKKQIREYSILDDVEYLPTSEDHSTGPTDEESPNSINLIDAVNYLSRLLDSLGTDQITDRQLVGRLGKSLRDAADKGLVKIEKVDDVWVYRLPDRKEEG